jgi:hypothetical protein
MRLHHSLTVILFTLSTEGCGVFEANETRFLSRAQDRATQEEVQQRLGLPTLTKAAPSGESTWVYRIFDWQPGNRVTAPGSWCDEYILTFDDQHILRQWTHRNYFHGGEAFPTECLPHRYHSSPE